jgi:hypothetical protein
LNFDDIVCFLHQFEGIINLLEYILVFPSFYLLFRPSKLFLKAAKQGMPLSAPLAWDDLIKIPKKYQEYSDITCKT